jgi:plastocyanin
MHRTLHALALAGLLGVVLSVTACSGTSSSAPSSSTAPSSSGGKATVTLQNTAFSPPSLTVKSGETVTFNNADQVEHHIVVGTDDLGVQHPGESKTWTAPKDGVYGMKCLVHPSMHGQITVGAGGSTIGTLPTGGGGGTGGY